jgi:hypothetical protein
MDDFYYDPKPTRKFGVKNLICAKVQLKIQRSWDNLAVVHSAMHADTAALLDCRHQIGGYPTRMA